jgi:hypothetical protein
MHAQRQPNLLQNISLMKLDQIQEARPSRTRSHNPPLSGAMFHIARMTHSSCSGLIHPHTMLGRCHIQYSPPPLLYYHHNCCPCSRWAFCSAHTSCSLARLNTSVFCMASPPHLRIFVHRTQDAALLHKVVARIAGVSGKITVDSRIIRDPQWVDLTTGAVIQSRVPAVGAFGIVPVKDTLIDNSIGIFPATGTVKPSRIRFHTRFLCTFECLGKCVSRILFGLF